ncbi:MAG: GTP pyrophosphokinase [Candidatus Ozemobacter sibiricus]|jgi:GTP pyrophosphokinase|uniref:GTP pyrophosphokinase n=1 Tax=Candidatus Ozemobacter sibiricus TaxID=2268124 RepID=A0A367ZKR1_9BACT|nr:MAG: GTP pyrophosphokinase [Candidatus Ozemobacter sibiricus]
MELTGRFKEALAYAFDLHCHQIRKGSGVPYVAHLLAVAANVLDHGGDEEQAIAALLHDAVEDQGGRATAAAIRERFGERVAAIVAGCTDTELTPKPPWRQRKEAYLAHLAHAPADVLLVSASDKLHNARAILADLRQVGSQVWDRFSGGRDGTLWYYRALVTTYRAAFAAAAPERMGLIDDLEQVVAEIERRAGTA